MATSACLQISCGIQHLPNPAASFPAVRLNLFAFWNFALRNKAFVQNPKQNPWTNERDWNCFNTDSSNSLEK